MRCPDLLLNTVTWGYGTEIPEYVYSAARGTMHTGSSYIKKSKCHSYKRNLRTGIWEKMLYIYSRHILYAFRRFLHLVESTIIPRYHQRTVPIQPTACYLSSQHIDGIVSIRPQRRTQNHNTKTLGRVQSAKVGRRKLKETSPYWTISINTSHIVPVLVFLHHHHPHRSIPAKFIIFESSSAL